MYSFARTLLLFLISIFTTLTSVFNFENIDSSLGFLDTNSVLNLSAAVTGYNGTLNLKDDTSTTFVGSNLTFNEGRLNVNSVTGITGSSSLILKGVYNPTTMDKFVLSNGEFIHADEENTVTKKIEIAGSVTASIFGSPRFSTTLDFVGSSSTLELNLKTKLNQNITSANATNMVKLLADLALEDRVKGFVATGTALIDLNGFIYEFGELSKEWLTEGSLAHLDAGTTTAIAFSNPGTTGGIRLQGNMTCLQNLRGFGHLYGQGNTLELTDRTTNGAKIDLVDGDIELENVHLVIREPIINSGTTERNLILLDNVVIEFQQENIAVSGGQALDLDLDIGNGSNGIINVIARGNNCKIITGGGTLTFGDTSLGSNPTNLIVEDNVTLIYDTLDQPDEQNIRFGGSGTFTLGVNSKLVHISSLLSLPTNSNIAIDASQLSVFYLQSNIKLVDDLKISITNSVGGAQTLTFDGLGNSIKFPDLSVLTDGLTIADNVTVTFQNVTFEDFNDSAINLNTSGALNFGQNVIMNLNRDVTINGSTGIQWNFLNGGTINGNGNSLDLDASAIVLAGGTLEIKNLTLNVKISNAINQTTVSAKTVFKNVSMVLNADLEFDTGEVEIQGNVFVVGANLIFSSPSPATFTIGENSTLTLEEDTIFEFSAPTNSQLVMTDSTARLKINGGTLDASGATSGLVISSGKIVVEGDCTLVGKAAAAAGEELEIKSSVPFVIESFANLNIQGSVVYDA